MRGLLAAALLTLATAAGAAEVEPDLTGVWRMPRAEEVTGPALRTPPIPAPDWTPAFAKIAAQEAAARQAADAEGRPVARDREVCIPDGMPKMMTTDAPLEILQTPGQVTIITEFMSQTRRIRLGGKHAAEAEPGFFGDSVGRWEGDALVVDTIGLKDRVRLFGEAPRSDALKIVERFRLIAPDVLEDEITVHDEKALATPWVVLRVYVRRPDLRIAESVCAENNRNYRDADGRLATRLPGE
jgi:hypothetical protein